jgi:HD-GYP domain-containing protein (c-di-GMP phosphodiesterase class II)
MLRVKPDAWMEEDQPSDREVDRIKRHPLLTAEWLEETYYHFNSIVFSNIKRHHERLDGSGYPLKIKDKKLSLPQKILILADVYDAMSTTRPHRSAISPDKVITYLQNRLNKFDAEVVDFFNQNLGSYPPGTVVQLNTNEIGVSLPGGDDPSIPTVKIMIDDTGNVYDEPEIVNLNDESDRRIIDTIGNRNTPTAILELMGQ